MSKSRFRRWGTTLIAVPVMVLGALVFSATSAAASIGVVTVDADTQTDVGGDNTETVTAECDGGSTLIGTGWIAGGAIVDEVVPDLSTGTVRVEAWEPEGGSVRANWSVTARAICATSVSNVEVVQDGSSAYNSTNAPKSETASCPFAKKLVGLGYEIGTFAEGEVHVTSVVPTDDEVTVTAYEDANGTTESWSVTAYAVCATEPSGLEVVTSTSPSTSSDLTVCRASRRRSVRAERWTSLATTSTSGTRRRVPTGVTSTASPAPRKPPAPPRRTGQSPRRSSASIPEIWWSRGRVPSSWSAGRRM
jgi:hypothetical protein